MAEIASAYVTLLPSAKGFGSKLGSQIGGDVDKAGKTSGSRFGKVFATASMSPLRAFGVAALGLFAVDKVKNFFAASFGEARESQKVGALTAQVIKTTGGAANVSAKQIGSLATAISNKVGIDDEAIQSGENMLLTFTNVRNEVGKGNKVFSQATKLAVDMSTALGGDAKSAALQLGKALNDPAKGVTKLARSGVSFTEQQIKQIKAMQASGNLLGAQKIILGEVAKEFGGAAAAQATAGDKMSVAVANFKEQVGTALLPALDGLQNAVTTRIVPAMSTFVSQLQTGEGAGGRVAAAFAFLKNNLSTIAPVLATIAAGFVAYRIATAAAAVVTAIQTAATAAAAAQMTLLNFALRANPIGIVITALTLLGVGLVLAYKKSETFRNIVNGAFTVIRTVVGSVVDWLSRYVPRAFAIIATGVRTYINIYRTVVVTAFNVVRLIAGAVGSFVAGTVRFYVAYLNGVRSTFGKVISFVREIPGKIISALGNLGGVLIHSGEALIAGFAQGIRNKAAAAYNEAKSMLSKVKNLFPHSPAPEGPFSGRGWVLYSGQAISEALAKGISDKAPKAVKAAFNLVGRIKSQIDTLMESFGSLRDSIASTFTSGLFDVSAAISSTTSVFAQSVTAGASSMAQSFVNNLLTKKGELTRLVAAFKKLVSWGLSPTFLSSLFQSGNGALILDLAAGPASQAQVASTTFGQIQGLAQQLGTQVATDVYGPQIVNRLDALRKSVNDLPKGIRKELDGTAKNSRRR